MNPPLKNFLCFGGALVFGVLLTVLNGNLGLIVSPLTATAMAFCAGICLFLFGRPHENLRQGRIGWGLLGLAAGLIAPYAFLFAFLAG